MTKERHLLVWSSVAPGESAIASTGVSCHGLESFDVNQPRDLAKSVIVEQTATGTSGEMAAFKIRS